MSRKNIIDGTVATVIAVMFFWGATQLISNVFEAQDKRLHELYVGRSNDLERIWRKYRSGETNFTFSETVILTTEILPIASKVSK